MEDLIELRSKWWRQGSNSKFNFDTILNNYTHITPIYRWIMPVRIRNTIKKMNVKYYIINQTLDESTSVYETYMRQTRKISEYILIICESILTMYIPTCSWKTKKKKKRKGNGQYKHKLVLVNDNATDRIYFVLLV